MLLFPGFHPHAIIPGLLECNDTPSTAEAGVRLMCASLDVCTSGCMTFALPFPWPCSTLLCGRTCSVWQHALPALPLTRRPWQVHLHVCSVL